MAPARKVMTAPSSPFLQVATPPESPPRVASLWNVDEDDRKPVLDAVRQALIDKMPVPPPFDMNRQARCSEAAPGSTIRSSNVMPPNAPRTPHLGSVAMNDAKEPIGLMVPSPNDRRAYANWTSAAADHRF
ncbi:uncharacterized protein BO80DRAFT_420786 [Aspergillus ibericus CBS 121593]|uniref:Uncharacterized protein n=1 Tax=Aspergillus ibericus CBS 121593 TaxID=1448316 RepID=A0A395HDN3_9EURO|nr:hypothetical protein BO80DRAFT_420786 [Aspergillus ibericus CBS 121593]RAL05583.1 hypothetical protein BO80DRAFT_420786 [Aspergillus ibericus CBS 121593]